MYYLRIFILIITVSIIAVSCKQKEMTPKDFLKIDIEITTTDMKPESIEKVSKKYGFSSKQYYDFEQKVLNNPKLKEKLGELRLKSLDNK